MPRTRRAWEDGVFGTGLFPLLERVFLQLALDSDYTVYLEGQDEIVHPFFSRIQQEFGDRFPELRKLKFELRNGIPHSKDLEGLLHNRLHTLLARDGTLIRIKLPGDARARQDRELTRLLRGDKEKEREFLELVEKFRELIPRSLPPTA